MKLRIVILSALLCMAQAHGQGLVDHGHDLRCILQIAESSGIQLERSLLGGQWQTSQRASVTHL